MTHKALKQRRKTKEIKVGNVGIGGDNPVRVQTMTNTDIFDKEATVKQIVECVEAGSELIRISTQTPKHAKMLPIIREELTKLNINIPLIADIHYLPEAAFEALKYADKVRLNPGNFIDKKLLEEKKFSDESYNKELAMVEESLLPFIEKVKEANIPLRIGANHGSLSDRIISRYGNTATGMVESVMEYLRIFKKNDFNNLVVALKASDPLVMIEANRLAVEQMNKENMDYPLHLGVTEAGNADAGRAKSTVGIGTLLLEGTGDTIRVSLSEHPAKEIPVCYDILQATGRRYTKTEFISCPTCGRTSFDLEKVINEVKEKMSHLKGIRIAVMGCAVNGLGEANNADYCYVGTAPGMMSLYYKGKLVQENISENNAIEPLVALIKEKEEWI